MKATPLIWWQNINHNRNVQLFGVAGDCSNEQTESFEIWVWEKWQRISRL